MCAPGLAAPLLIASTALSAGGAIMQGISAQQQGNYASQVAAHNARTSAAQAKDAEANTALEAQRRYRQSAQTLGAQQAALAANGVDINFGTAADLPRDARMFAAEDVGQIYKAGNAKAQGYDTEGWNTLADGAAMKAKGQGAFVSSLFSAAGTALGGASQVAKMKKGA